MRLNCQKILLWPNKAILDIVLPFSSRLELGFVWPKCPPKVVNMAADMPKELWNYIINYYMNKIHKGIKFLWYSISLISVELQNKSASSSVKEQTYVVWVYV